MTTSLNTTPHQPQTQASEAKCKEFNEEVRSIADGLQRMRSSGILTQEHFEWASTLRVLRNEAAHTYQTNVSEEDASDALDLLEAILKLTYKTPPEFGQF